MPRASRINESTPTVGLFVTCLVDLFRPSIGFAAVSLLRDAGCRVVVPRGQTCCGQPAYNSGNRRAAAEIAHGVVAAFEDCDYVVAPSGSCAAMIRMHFPKLFPDDPTMKARADALAGRSWELVSFLVEIMGVERCSGRLEGSATYHDGCSGLWELGIGAQPRRLLAETAGLTLRELGEPDVCCGFGGTFCVKHPPISAAMADNKLADIAATGADTLLAGELGCLMQIAGRMHRKGMPVRARHVAEVLAGMADGPAIGEPSEG